MDGKSLNVRDPKKVLAYGEVTGHAHVVNDPNAIMDHDSSTLTAPNGTNVDHEEHKTVKLPAGDYEITQQREIDPDTEEARRVAD